MALMCFQSVQYRQFNDGYTLIELMVTVVLMGIMVAMVTPLGLVAEGVKLDYLNQRIYSGVALARSEAIKRSETVSVCRSTAGTACNTGVNWADGWVVFVNSNNNNAIDAGEEIIRVYNPVSSPVVIGWNDGPMLTFSPRGIPEGQGTFSLCPVPTRPLPRRQVNVSGSGLIRKQEGSNC